jgi:hypothetical protein
MKRTGEQTPAALAAFLDWIDAQIDVFKAGYDGALAVPQLRDAGRLTVRELPLVSSVGSGKKEPGPRRAPVQDRVR